MGNMGRMNSGFTRRDFLETGTAAAAAAAAASSLPLGAALAQGRAKYTRYNVTSEGGKKALASYAKAVNIMLKLPANDPHNWFRNSFVHFMDCPHGNWWFYVWHRGFLGFFERTIREISGDASFAIPYWDWTQLPQIPAGMFDGALTPTDKSYEPITANLDTFTKFLKKPLFSYWGGLNGDQLKQLDNRGYKTFDLMWNDVQGYVPSLKYAVAGNIAFAPTSGARYLTRTNPKLDPNTAYDVSPDVVGPGLLVPDFYNDDIGLSFNSSKTPSHNTSPSQATKFSTLEGMPHNKVHNYIGGYGPLNYGPYGNMTNNLSPVDPIFFLHHSNMDRLWDVWTRRQQAHGQSWEPSKDDAETYYNEPFLFFVDAKGQFVTKAKAKDFFNKDVFGYDYEPGYGEEFVKPAAVAAAAANPAKSVKGSVHGNAGTVAVPSGGAPTMVEVTVARPDNGNREFDVTINDASGHPHFAGTIAFFGHMAGMTMPMDATFPVPLPKSLQTSAALAAPKGGAKLSAKLPASLHVSVTPSGGGNVPALKALSLTVH